MKLCVLRYLELVTATSYEKSPHLVPRLGLDQRCQSQVVCKGVPSCELVTLPMIDSRHNNEKNGRLWGGGGRALEVPFVSRFVGLQEY